MYLYGASGHAKVIYDSLRESGKAVKGLFDDNPLVKELLGLHVFGKFNIDVIKDDELIISVGINSTRKKIVEKLPKDLKYGIAVHPSAIISQYSSLGKGTVIMHGVIIQSSTKIGEHCIINTSASVDHDCVIEDFVHISPKACLCGGVTVGEGTQVGAGAVIIPGIKVGKWSLIAAGAVVLKDVPDNVMVLGNPGRVIKSINLL